MKKFLSLLLVLLIAVAALPGLAAVRAQEQKTFVIGLSENSTSLDPARGYDSETSIIHAATYETLVTFPPDSVDQIIPGLATSWTISDDGLTYTFTLAEGRKFASGNELTADDVVFSYNRLINVKGNPSSVAATIDSVTASDAKTVVIKLKKNDPAILAELAFSGFSVSDSKVVKEHGGTDAADADKTDTAEAWLNNNSVGTGPYVLTKWEKDTEIVLAKNPNYNGSMAPGFDQIIIRNIPEASAQKAALEAGDIDLAFDLSADQMASLKSNPDLKVYEGIGPYVFFLLMNQDPAIGGPMSNPKVQQAVRLAIDYAGIAKLVGGASATPGSLIPLGFATAFTTDQAIKQDVEAAKALIAESGLTDITTDLNYWDTTYSGVNIGVVAQKIQADLKEIGITVNLTGGDIQVKLASYRDGKDPFGLWFWGPDFIDPLNYAEFLPAMKVGTRANWTNDNSDKEIQDLRDAVLTETDAAKRADLFAKIQAYWQKAGPFAPLLQSPTQIGYRADLKGFAYNYQWAINPATFSR
ncbi:MAG: ABC transporter substrate-binding protein [Anaerolineae bacterium]|nr:ABC transporter substrate-binding protein [Anaerolineae bacterium]